MPGSPPTSDQPRSPVSTPPFGPESLGPEPRPDGQFLWDPGKQAMDPDERRALQNARLRHMVERIFAGPVPLFVEKLAAAGVEAAGDITSVDDLASVPSTVKQDLRDSEAAAPPWGGYRFTDPRYAVRLGTSTGTTGQPTITVWTRRDLWIEYESGARNWWRMGYRPGTIVTHAHPAYLYGGGVMLQGTYEYLGLLSLWVPPPDTDELAEQAMRFWTRVTPDIPFMGFATGRFLEVAAKLGIPLEDAGLTGLKAPPGFGLGRGGMPLMTAGAECYAYVGGPCGESPGAHIHEDWAVVQAVDPATGREVPDGEWGNLTVTTLDRDNGLLRYDLEEACAILREPCPAARPRSGACGAGASRIYWRARAPDSSSPSWNPSCRKEPLCAQPSLEYQVTRPGDESAPLRVQVEVATEDPAERRSVAQRLRAAIHSQLGVDAFVESLARDTLPRAGYKAKRVVDPDV